MIISLKKVDIESKIIIKKLINWVRNCIILNKSYFVLNFYNQKVVNIMNLNKSYLILSYSGLTK